MKERNKYIHTYVHMYRIIISLHSVQLNPIKYVRLGGDLKNKMELKPALKK